MTRAMHLNLETMKNTTLLFFFSTLFFCLNIDFSNAQTTNLEWGHSMGSSGDDAGWDITTDIHGNVYTTGYFQGTVDLDPSATSEENFTSNGDRDIFVQKVDANGNYIWAYTMGSSAIDEGMGLHIDASGNVYVIGIYQGTVDFDPGAGVANLTSVAFRDAFIQKLDANGNFLWAKSFGGTSNERVRTILTDAGGDIYITGTFQATADFDPGPAVVNRTSAGGQDIYLLKLDASGNFVWVNTMGASGYDVPYCMQMDASNNFYLIGGFESVVDFDPGIGTFNLSSSGASDAFVQKINSNGDFLWAKSMGNTGGDVGYSLATDSLQSVYLTGWFQGTVDLDPGVGVFNLTSVGGYDAFIQKLDSSGNFLWAKSFGGTGDDKSMSLYLGNSGNIYIGGSFDGTADFDPGVGTFNLSTNGSYDLFLLKLNANGNFIWAESMGGASLDLTYTFHIDPANNIYFSGFFQGNANFEPGVANVYLSSLGSSDAYTVKYRQRGVLGRVYQDYDQNCTQAANETGLSGRVGIINPGNIVVTTNNNGIWSLDSLPAGTYTMTIDTTSMDWLSTCPSTQSFVVASPNGLTIGASFGFVSVNACTAPNISIHAPFLRPGFSNQKVYVSACNLNVATTTLDTAYVIVELDSLLVPQSASLPYTSLGNNEYLVDVGTIYPGFCVDFWFDCTLSTSATLGQTLCLDASLYPVDSCSLDTIANPYPVGSVSPCTLPWDRSSLSVEGSCLNDSIRFVVHNTGDFGSGDMDCFAPVRLYIDGQYVMLDSIQLVGGDSIVFMFDGDGRTFRLEADQHPLHPGNSHPNASVELCGSGGVWTPDLVNVLPQDDADPVVDIFCGLVRGSYDPNDKTGFPLGFGATNNIEPGQELEYLIRFQNTGTDTAFTIVVRDTLSTNLDILSVRSGVSSNDYSFRMYGPRVLEWTFHNIMLPDSNINEPNSHGFIQFKVDQIDGLPLGTTIENSAAIYFDYNAPIITNTATHTINEQLITVSVETVYEERVEVKVYPNPFTHSTTLEVLGEEYSDLEVNIYDMMGRRVMREVSSYSNKIQVEKGNLLPGVYLYELIGEQKLVSTGKLIVR